MPFPSHAMSSQTYSISDLSRELDITTRAIRFYEEQGLLSPERRGLERVYSARDKVSLKLILRGKRIGFSLAECRELIELYDPTSGNQKQLHSMLAKIAERRAQLEQQLLDIQQMQLELDTAEERCQQALATTLNNQKTAFEAHRNPSHVIAYPCASGRSRPRDGLQNEAQPISVADKVRLVDDLTDAGVSYIEVGSFVSPKWVPQMAGSADVFASIRQQPGITYAALAPTCAVSKTHWPQASRRWPCSPPRPRRFRSATSTARSAKACSASRPSCRRRANTG